MTEPLQAALPRTAALERSTEWIERIAPFLLSAAASGLLAADHGGYGATTWGWAALTFAWVAALGLVLRDARVSRLELGWIGALAALTAWTAASMIWTSSQTSSALEVERTLVYALAALAVVAVTRSTGYRGLLWGTWTGSTLACLYALATRLFPERLGVTDPVAGYRLSAPIGYWNGLGLLATMALVLSVGLATFGRALPARVLAAATVPLLLPTLYFTFSRGAWVALAAALVAAFALSPRRLALASSLLVQALPAAAALWLAYQARPLRETNVSLADAVHAGHTLAWRLLLLAGTAAAMKLVYDLVASRIHVTRTVRRGFAVVLLAVLAVGCVGVLVHYGGPTGAIDRARRSIDSTAVDGTNLNQRLFSLSSNGRLRQWHVALDEWHAHPLLGGGAGTYAEYWAAAGPDQGQILNVHNLYLETLADLGPIGLALLAVALALPLAAAVRARQRSLVPIATAAYVAWLVHVVYDWDWQLPGVTITAILCASALLVAARRGSPVAPQAPARWGLLAATAVTGLAALFGLLGNQALAKSARDVRAGNTSAAVAAVHDARRWAPWSSQPWAQLAFIRHLQGHTAATRAAYEQAVAKDPRNWELWLGLLTVSRGSEAAHALARLKQLSPAAAAGAKGNP